MKKLTMVLGIVACGILATVALTSAATPASNVGKVGVVDFKSCFEGSKLGKQEQARFETMKKGLETKIESKEKELDEMQPKFSDEYLDTLSPEAEAELKGKYQQLAQELSVLQNQYYSSLQQANYQIVNQVSESVAQAAKKVALKNSLDLALNSEVCFFNNSSLDISKDVITEMDAAFDQDAKNQTEKK
jgi:outer membrane protein